MDIPVPSLKLTARPRRWQFPGISFSRGLFSAANYVSLRECRWWFPIFSEMFSPILGEMIQFDEHISIFFKWVETMN